MFISRNARFLEEDYINYFKPRSKLMLRELLGNVITTPHETIPKPIIKEISFDPPPVELRRSGMFVRQLEKYMSYRGTLVAVSDQNDDEPCT